MPLLSPSAIPSSPDQEFNELFSMVSEDDSMLTVPAGQPQDNAASTVSAQEVQEPERDQDVTVETLANLLKACGCD